MNSIPKSFQLGGRTWEVRMVSEDYMRTRSKADSDETVLGLCSIYEAEIIIVQGLKAEATHAVYYHELTHALFETMGWIKMSKDEGKVDAMSTMLHQYLQTTDY